MPPAQAQNLITDPYFANGLPANQSQTSDGTFYYDSATATMLDGTTGIEIAQNGFFEIASIPGYNTNSVNYVFTFLAAALDPSQSTNFLGEFGDTTFNSNCGCGDATVNSSLTSTTLSQYTLTGTSSGSSGVVFVEPQDVGGIFITGLDLEAAPSPVPGGGILSFGVMFAGLATYRIRSRARS